MSGSQQETRDADTPGADGIPTAGGLPGGGSLPVPATLVRDVVIHLTNEQPLLADLLQFPSPSDAAIVCTNLRTMSGKRPVFVDSSEAVFVFPLGQLRFVEIPPSGSAHGRRREEATEAEAPTEPDLEIDESFLRRVREA